MKKKTTGINVTNRKARFDYDITDTFEAGIVLTGKEIKAIRAGKSKIEGSYVKIINAEAFWLGGTIQTLSSDNQRTRKLLLHENEIKTLIGKTQEQGMALIPLKLYLKRGRAKLELGLGKGMKKYDKRAKIKERDLARDIQRKIS